MLQISQLLYRFLDINLINAKYLFDTPIILYIRAIYTEQNKSPDLLIRREFNLIKGTKSLHASSLRRVLDKNRDLKVQKRLKTHALNRKTKSKWSSPKTDKAAAKTKRTRLAVV